MVAAPISVHVVGQKKKYFASDCSWNESFVLVSLLLEFISAPNSFRVDFVNHVFKSNHSRKLPRFTISLNTELASLVEPKIYFYLWARVLFFLLKHSQPFKCLLIQEFFILYVFFNLEFSSFAWFSCAEYLNLLLLTYLGKWRCQKATEMHIVALTSFSGWAQEWSLQGTGTLPSQSSAITEHMCHRLQISVAPYNTFPVLNLWVHAGTNLPCTCWVVQWSHITTLNLPSKGDFVIIFKFCLYFANLQPPGPEVQLLLILRLHSWCYLPFLDTVMPNSQSHIAAI